MAHAPNHHSGFGANFSSSIRLRKFTKPEVNKHINQNSNEVKLNFDIQPNLNIGQYIIYDFKHRGSFGLIKFQEGFLINGDGNNIYNILFYDQNESLVSSIKIEKNEDHFNLPFIISKDQSEMKVGKIILELEKKQTEKFKSTISITGSK